MKSDIKFTPDGQAALVIGDAPARQTSNDGGRTLVEEEQSYVCVLPVEVVATSALLDERPVYDADTATWVQPGQQAQAAPAAGTPGGTADVPATPQRAEAQNADELQAQIDALVAQKAALENNDQAS